MFFHRHRFNWHGGAALGFWVQVAGAVLLSGCGSTSQMAPNLSRRHAVDPAQLAEPATGGKAPFAMPRGPKKLLVFFDGTANQWDSRTNVRRLFEMLGGREDPRRLCFYVEGVGDEKRKLMGQAFGKGLQRRITASYAFLSEYYQAGDEIYIFGFSRGGHAARTLAGLISHCGLIETNGVVPGQLKGIAGKVVDWCQETCEGGNLADWQWAVSTGTPLYPSRLDECDVELKKTFPCRNRYAEVKFLGVWDAVPGSTFKQFGAYEEMEDSKPGIRYKLGAYPPIREIAHAVSLDEQRRMFRPVLFDEPLDPSRTTLHQEWFAGVHSDVGGGYANSSEMSGVTLTWMLGFLADDGLFSGGVPSVYQNAAGLQHDSWNASPLWRKWKREPRWRPAEAPQHPSVAERSQAAAVWIDLGQKHSVKTNYLATLPGKRPREWAGTVLGTMASLLGRPERVAAGSPTNEFLIDPRNPWNHTAYEMKRGRKYRLTAIALDDAAGQHYQDSSYRCDADGPVTFAGRWFNFMFRNPGWYNPAFWSGPGRVKRLRVLEDGTGQKARFLTVIGAIGRDDARENVFVIGRGREIIAPADGELVLFCNDWPGGCGKTGDNRFANSMTYPNNTGRVRVTVEAVD